MKSWALGRFWRLHGALPPDIRRAADKQFSLWRQNPQHRSLHFKRIRHNLWSARVNDNDRALATFDGDTWLWFWIGQHDEYERLLKDDR